MNLVDEERRKYARMWSVPEYRRHSPGLAILPTVLDLLEPEPGATFTDFGSGPEGLVVDRLNALGFLATGIDFVSEHPDVHEACLWTLPSRPQTEFGVCFDVLEHIPPQHVAAVLDRINHRSRWGVAMTVATIPCTVGKRHGETLHETVEPVEWWDDVIAAEFGDVTRHPTDREWRWLYVVTR